jgi:hypothetical protein
LVPGHGLLIVGRGHSVLGDGRPVRFAGELKFDKSGNLVEITNHSGHYKATSGVGLTAKAKEFLQLIGIDVSNATIREE